MTAASEISYTDLYSRWEQGNWRATEIDFTVDREQWHNQLDADDRRAALWNYALFFHGEEAVAETLGPFITAAPKTEQKHFLTTQQVDETRHAVFFARFLSEVVDRGDSIDSSLAATAGELTWGFRGVFGILDEVSADLRRKPTLPKLAAGIVLYHLMIEATLAHSGQYFIGRYLEERDLLPGFREGMRLLTLDEHRHIGFGVKMLSDLVAEEPKCKDAVIDMLRRVTPLATAVFEPPGWDESYLERFGYSMVDIVEEGQRSFEARMRAAGLPPEELEGAVPFPYEMTPRERAERVVTLMRARVFGKKTGPPKPDPEAIAIVFDTICRAVDHRHAPRRPVTIQWTLSDMEPWHMVVDNGSSRVTQGRAARADVEFRCHFEDLVDVFSGRQTPTRQVLTRRMRPRGNPLLLMRAQKMLGG